MTEFEYNEYKVVGYVDFFAYTIKKRSSPNFESFG